MSEKTYLVIVQLKNAQPERLQTLVPSMIEALTRIGKAPPEQAFRSLYADTFGFGIKTQLGPHQVVSLLQSPHNFTKYNEGAPIEPFLDGDDALLVLELGHDYQDTKGFTRFGSWFQRMRVAK